MSITIGIIGAGAWGTALASVALSNNYPVRLWAKEPAAVEELNSLGTNSEYLPGAKLIGDIAATHNLDEVLHCDILVNAIPTQHVRSVWQNAQPKAENPVLVNVSKGIELHTHLKVSEVLADVLQRTVDFVVLSGPSHAEEVVQQMPTTVVCAGKNIVSTQVVQEAFSTDTFRVYSSDDVVGVEICGAIKNVVAIAAGIVDGIGLGDNTKAALITRGLAEMSRLGVALGAQQQTFYGLAGLGDLFVTCTSQHSRNRFVGEEIGKGKSLSEILASMHAVAEGVPTTEAALDLASTVGVELPITQKVWDILHKGADAKQAISDLMLRPKRKEH